MSVILRLLGFLKKYWKRAIAAYICLLAATAFSLAIPRLVGNAVDLVVGRGEPRVLLFLALAVIGAAAFRGVFAYGQSYLAEWLSQRVAYDIRNVLYDCFQRLSASFHDRAQTGDLMSRATADVEVVRWFISFGVLRSAYLVVLFIAISIVLLSLNWKLALISFAFFPLIGFRAVTVSRRLRPLWLKIQQEIAALGTILQENLTGIRVVKAFSRREYEGDRFAAKAEVIYFQNLEANRQQAFNTPLMAFFLIIGIAAVLWYGGREVIAGRLSPGELTQCILYLQMMAMPVRLLGAIVNMFSRASSSGKRIFEILDAQSAVKEALHAFELPLAQGVVRFEGVSFSYDSVSPVLKKIDLEAKPGEVIALLGATGSGKSTIVNLLPRLYDASGGRITIDGIDIRDVTLSSLRSNVGIVQQDVFLFSATIRDNIAYGKADADLDSIIAVAKAARLHDFIESLPEGYSTWVGERGITLSGGQKQRLAIARTLLMNPRILILDDATSSVDAETELLIQQALIELMRGRTTFVIAQRLNTVRHANQILVLKDGEIMERGTHAELLQCDGIHRPIYQQQFRPQEDEYSYAERRGWAGAA